MLQKYKANADFTIYAHNFAHTCNKQRKTVNEVTDQLFTCNIANNKCGMIQREIVCYFATRKQWETRKQRNNKVFNTQN